jgi:hypothetical protein
MKHFAMLMGLCVLLAACSHGAQQAANQSTGAPGSPSSGSPAPALFYPPGIVPPGNYTAETSDGIYSADTAAQCCFMAGKATLTLDHPVGAQLAVFKMFVPSVKPFLKDSERVTVAFNGVQAGAPAILPAGLHDVIFTIPAALRGKHRLTATLAMSIKWVPKNIGLNADERELSILLLRVGYI